MKTCKACQKEFDENLTYCPFCGAENADKKLTYFERKHARDRDTQIILDKASIQQSDEDVAQAGNVEELVVEKVQDFKKAKVFCIARFSASVVFAIACLVFGWITISNDINNNLKLIVILVAFLAIGVCASIIISDIYAYVTMRKMNDGDFSIRKIYYSKGPMFRSGNGLYEIKTYKKCDECQTNMHVEVKDDVIFLVCDTNRSHLYKIEKDAYIAYFKDKLSK